MIGAKTRGDLIRAAEAALAGKASSLTKQRVVDALDQMPTDPDGIEATLKRIRALIQLFIDEGLAREVYDELRRIAE